MTSQFMAYDEDYTGRRRAVDGLGGGRRGWREEHRDQPARRRRHGAGVVDAGRCSTVSRTIYLESPNHHEQNVKYAQIASFAPFPGAPGVTVATTSTTTVPTCWWRA